MKRTKRLENELSCKKIQIIVFLKEHNMKLRKSLSMNNQTDTHPVVMSKLYPKSIYQIH